MVNGFVFQEHGDKLKFIGDFEGLYKYELDPWQQSGKTPPYDTYYTLSRGRLVSLLANAKIPNALEVGCGFGQVCALLRDHMPNTEWEGLDISETAIERARQFHAGLVFHVADITDHEMILPGKYDLVLLNQILWYIVDKLDVAIANCHRLLIPGGSLVLSQAFLRNQRYANEIVDGFKGMIELFDKRYHRDFKLVHSSFIDLPQIILSDGMAMWQVK